MGKLDEYRRTGHELFEEKVISNEEISPGVYLLSVLRRFDFIPGQVVKLSVEHEQPPRIYSICSGNHEDELRILFNIKEDGYLTPLLAKLIPGDKVLITKPYGGFSGSTKPAWWIAAGTGIAPFYSMFQSGLSYHKVLIHGASYLNQFYFEDELDWAMGKKYLRCCSREHSCDVYPGRVTDYIKSLEKIPVNIEYYLCGKALMVVEVRDLLIERGVPYENIIAEIYF